jgi:hypothetical protein
MQAMHDSILFIPMMEALQNFNHEASQCPSSVVDCLSGTSLAKLRIVSYLLKTLSGSADIAGIAR